MPDLVGFPTDGDDGSVSSEARWRQMARLWAPSGVVAGYLGDLAPSLSAGTITVQAGAAWVDGHYCEASGSSTFTATVTGLVVVRFTPADNHFELLYRDGATAPTQTTATWELPIARITASVLYDVRTVIPVGGSTSTQLGHVALTAAAADIDFPNIPQTFNHLRIVALLRGTAAALQTAALLRLNGSSASQYFTQRARASATSATALETLNGDGFQLVMPAASAHAEFYAPITVDIPGYRQPNIRRTVLTQNGSTKGTGVLVTTDMSADTGYGILNGTTAAITRLTLTAVNNLAAGSTATLYGLM